MDFSDSLKTILVLVGLSLLVGCLHEALQLLTADIWPGWSAKLLDISVDLGGAVLGLASKKIYSLYWMKKRS